MEPTRILVALLAVATGAAPPLIRAQVLEMPGGTVEFIGLHHWTPEQVRDTLAAVSPDVPLTSSACAAALQFDLGFPAAAVNRYSLADGALDRVVITVVEPEESDRVRFAPPPPDSLADRPRWARAYEILEDRSWAWHAAMQYRDAIPSGRFWEAMGKVDTTAFTEARAFLEHHTTEEDLALALEVLARDRNWESRVIALGILGRFPKRPEAWHAVIRTTRGYGSQDWSRDRGAMSIAALTRHAPESLDWSPVADDLKALLDGTTLFAFVPLLEVLAETGLAPDLTRELLSDGAPLVIDHLAASSPHARQAARRFLERVSGEEHGVDVEAWRAWIGSLEGPRGS